MCLARAAALGDGRRDQYSNPIVAVAQTFTVRKSAAVYDGAADQVITKVCGPDSTTGGYACEFKYQELSRETYSISVYLGAAVAPAMLIGGSAIAVPINPPGSGSTIYIEAPCEDLGGVNVSITVASIFVMLVGVASLVFLVMRWSNTYISFTSPLLGVVIIVAALFHLLSCILWVIDPAEWTGERERHG